MKDYWSTITEGDKLYQMGAQSHRVYLLDEMKHFGIFSFLDVGCGTAPLFELIQDTMLDQKDYVPMNTLRWPFIYKGVDPSEAMIQTCKKHFPNGNFMVENATNLSTETDDSFDAVVFLHSFDYIYDYKLALEEARRVAKKYVVICLWQPLEDSDDHRLNNTVNGVENVDWSTARLQHFSWRKFQEELPEIGFQIVEKKDDAEINQEGRHNTLIILKKI